MGMGGKRVPSPAGPASPPSLVPPPSPPSSKQRGALHEAPAAEATLAVVVQQVALALAPAVAVVVRLGALQGADRRAGGGRGGSGRGRRRTHCASPTRRKGCGVRMAAQMARTHALSGLFVQ